MDRPNKIEHEKVQVGPRRQISEIIGDIPPKYLSCVKDNNLLDDCCRDVESSFISTFRSKPDLPQGTQDLVEIQCDKCAKIQYRTFVNVGQITAPTQ